MQGLKPPQQGPPKPPLPPSTILHSKSTGKQTIIENKQI
jgi:hypothetical protein